MKQEQKEKIEKWIRISSPYLIQKAFFFIQHKRQYDRWKKAGAPVPPPRLIKESIITRYLKSTGYSILIETGTFRGDMIFAQLRNAKKI